MVSAELVTKRDCMDNSRIIVILYIIERFSSFSLLVQSAPKYRHLHHYYQYSFQSCFSFSLWCSEAAIRFHPPNVKEFRTNGATVLYSCVLYSSICIVFQHYPLAEDCYLPKQLTTTNMRMHQNSYSTTNCKEAFNIFSLHEASSQGLT